MSGHFTSPWTPFIRTFLTRHHILSGINVSGYEVGIADFEFGVWFLGFGAHPEHWIDKFRRQLMPTLLHP